MRRTLTVMAAAAVMALGTVTMASAGVERYQFTDVVLNIDSVNGQAQYWHDYTFRHNPCTDQWTVSEATGSQGPETIDVDSISVDGNQVTFTSDYDLTSYVYTATISVNNGELSLAGSEDIWGVTGTGSITQTSYNHGEYVAESIDDYGPDAHSCIGKPIVSNGR